MSRKDYIEAARRISGLLDLCTDDGRGDIRAEAIADTAKEMADLFEADNRAFDRQRFYHAAGLDEKGRPAGRSYGARPIS